MQHVLLKMTYKGTVALAPASNFSLILTGGEQTELDKKQIWIKKLEL